MPGISTCILESQARGGQTEGPVLGWLGLALWLQESLFLVVWAAMAILEGVIGQLLHLISKYLLSSRHFAGLNRHGPWPHGAYSLRGEQTVKIQIMYGHT